MGKLEYLDALKRAMTGLAPEAQAKTLAYYEQRFVDGVVAGRTEEDVAKELDDPKKIAMTLRASTHMQAFETKKNPANFLRMSVAVVGLAIFNLFMVVPAMVYASLLATLYAVGVAFYLGGSVVTGSGLSGANEIRLDGPLRDVVIFDDNDYGNSHTKVSIDENGIRVHSEPDTPKTPAAGVEGGVEAPVIASSDGDAEVAPDDIPDETVEDRPSVRVIKKAESVASQGIVVSTDMDDDSRITQTLVGFCMVLGGIGILLLALVITRYTLIGLKRYIEMNVSLLKGH